MKVRNNFPGKFAIELTTERDYHGLLAEVPHMDIHAALVKAAKEIVELVKEFSGNDIDDGAVDGVVVENTEGY